MFYFESRPQEMNNKDIPSNRSQSERAEIAIHWFGEYWCLLWVNQDKFLMRMSRSRKRKWLEILAGEDLPPKLCSNNADLNSVRATKEKTTTRNRGAERTSLSIAKS